MDALIDFGLEASRYLQDAFPFLAGFFDGISILGNEISYLLFLPLIYWCLHKEYGRHLSYVFLISTFVNLLGKHTFRQPRPFWLDETLRVSGESPSYGVPSGHSQNATFIALFFATKLRKTWVWWVAILFIALMMISRVYLGLHFVHDVLLGFILGVLVLVGYYLWLYFAHKLFTKRILGYRLMFAVILPLLLAGIYTAVLFLIGEPNQNAPWADFFEEAEKESIESITTAVSSLLGTGIGLIFEKSRVRFKVDGPIWKRTLRYIIGIAVAGSIWAGLGAIFPDEPYAVAIPLRAIRYTLLTLWITYYAPLIFVFTRLADAEPEPEIDLSLD
ncbi:MAG: phosphatase PAP2 family protein [Chloroflexota bacterium]